MKQKKSLGWNTLLIGMFLIIFLGACQFAPKSPDGRYQAEKWTRVEMYIKIHYPPTEETDCVVREIKTQRIVVITEAKYETPNNIKVCAFSDDSKKFAAWYDYGDKNDKKSQYNWAGVWSLETGELLYTKEEKGWVLVPKSFP